MRMLSSIALLAIGAAAQVIESQSFGYGKTYEMSPVACPPSMPYSTNIIVRISPSRDSIPGWKIGGEGHEPTLVSSLSLLLWHV